MIDVARIGASTQARLGNGFEQTDPDHRGSDSWRHEKARCRWTEPEVLEAIPGAPERVRLAAGEVSTHSVVIGHDVGLPRDAWYRASLNLIAVRRVGHRLAVRPAPRNADSE